MYIRNSSSGRWAFFAFAALLCSSLTSSAPLYSQTVAGSPEQTVNVKGAAPKPGTAISGATSNSLPVDVTAPGIVIDGDTIQASISPTIPLPGIVGLPEIAVAESTLPLKGKTIVVNAGHGGRDSGAHYGGVMEKDVTLKIALKVRDRLKELGATVVMTRTTDVDMSLAAIDSVTARVQPDAFLSIHCNAGARSMRGIETFYFYPESSRYATLMLHTLAGRLGARENFVHYNNFYVIDHTRVPATLVEVGYLSNKHDRSYLISADGQETIAKALAEGEVKFFSNTKK